MITRTTQHHEQMVSEYVAGVLSGDIVVGKLVLDACQRYADDLERIGDNDFPYYFDYSVAEEMCMFFPGALIHTTGQYDGEPFELYPWQAFIVWNLHGWRHSENDSRRFRRAFITVARGNGKSPLAAGIILGCFAFDQPVEVRAECYSFATKGKQARIVFEECQRYVSRNPTLRKVIESFRHNLNIPANGSKLEPMASESKSADGLIPHVVVCDELHEWREEHRGLFEKLETAMGKRRQPLWLFITTAGTDESDIWFEEYTLAKKTVERDNGFDAEHIFSFIAEIDDDDDELNEACWIKANPMLEYGIVKIDHLRQMAAQASGNATKTHEIRRYHCNKLTTSLNRPISSSMWSLGNCDLPDLADAKCFAGYDAGWSDDLASIGFVFPLDTVNVDGIAKRRYAIDADVWIPDGGKRDITKSPWKEWIDSGCLRVTQGNTTDVQSIFDRLGERHRQHQIRSLAYDGANAREFSTIAENGFGIETYAFGQTTKKYNEPVRELLLALQEGRIVHGGNGILAWCATNMAIKYDSSDYVMPVKKRSQDKIDPIVAILMALSEAMFAGNSPRFDFYESNDLELI